jgi:protein O-GlcNAc transferase
VTTDSTLDQARQALQRAEFAQAADLFSLCTSSKPDEPEIWFLLGASLDGCGKHEEALNAFGTAERLQPTLVQAINAQATMLSLLGRWQEALTTFRRALGLRSNDPQILTNIGITLEKLGREQEALQSFNAALAIDPNQLIALNNRGCLLLKQDRPVAALKDHLRFMEAAPHSPIGYFNYADACAALLRDQEALDHCNKALQLDPQHVKAHIVRGVMLSGLGRFGEAQSALKTAESLNPFLFAETFRHAGFDISRPVGLSPKSIYFLRGKERLQQCDWSAYADFVAALKRLASEGQSSAQVDFTSLAHVTQALPIAPELQLAMAQKAGAMAQNNVNALALSPRQNKPRLRIGYVSPDFRNHAVGHMTCRLYGLHDRTQYEVYGYALQPDDGGSIRREITAGCDVFRDCTAWSAPKIAERIGYDGIDILINLGGYTDNARPEIFALRPAPIIAGYLGPNGTMGAPYIDYWISDAVANPPEQDRYVSEKVVRLAGTCMTYNDQLMIDDAGSRAGHGLPQVGFVFCCFNTGFKIEPTIFALWMDLLKDVKDSVLWLYAQTPMMAANLTREAARQGIDAKRLVFAPPMPLTAHIGRYRLADLFLDTLYCNAQTTALDALWAGLPVLTCPGSTFAARMCSSLLTHLALPELITDSVEQYAAQARRLAANRTELASLRTRLATLRAGSPMFRSETIVRHLEQAYREMWRRHQAGLPPESFSLD